MNQKDDNSVGNDFDRVDSESEKVAPDATPLCVNCLKPVDPKQYYCTHCGSNEAINPLATYMPLVRIRHNYDIFITMWRKLWRRRTGSATIILFSFLIACVAPIMLMGLPIMLWVIFRDRHLRAYRLAVFGLIVMIVFMTFALLGRLPLLSHTGYRMSSHPVAPK
jgi:integral membrane sensor domain MASE1